MHCIQRAASVIKCFSILMVYEVNSCTSERFKGSLKNIGTVSPIDVFSDAGISGVAPIFIPNALFQHSNKWKNGTKSFYVNFPVH